MSLRFRGAIHRAISAVSLVALFLAASCPGPVVKPPDPRPTILARVCLVSNDLAGLFCPDETVTDRRFYTSPLPGEPVAPSILCRTHGDPDPLVSAEVCSVSRLTPNPFCPEKTTIEIRSSSLPLAVCSTHKDPDPLVAVDACSASSLSPGPYCVDRKTIEVRTSALPLAPCGIHTTPRLRVYMGPYDLMGSVGDLRIYLKGIRAAGAFGIRFFICYSWQGSAPLSPYQIVGVWTHESGRTFPLYRLGNPLAPAWNKEFWDKLSIVLQICREFGLEVWLVAEDFVSLKGDQRVKYFNPFYCSEEALGPSTPGGVWGDALKPYHLALFQKTIETAQASGATWSFEVMNEADAIDFSESDFIDWMKWAIGSVEGLGVPRSKMILTTGRAAAALAAEVGYFSPHGIGRPGDIRAIAGIPIEKTIFSSDGFGQGTGPADESGRPGVGLDVADELAREVLRIGAVSFELLDRGIWRNTPAGGSNNRADLSLSSTAVLDRMTRGR